MKKLIVFSVLSMFLVFLPISAFALSVTASGDANMLISEILGSGVTVSNVNYIGGSNASGTFTDGAGSIGMASGVILTSGSAVSAEGPNSSGAISTINNLAGDADLDALIPQSTHDATVLEFDFAFTSGMGGDLFFNFAFGSDEYNEWVGSQYNDVFALFVDGTNIALVPGTSTPVSINNVNNGSNSAYYNDNTSGIYDIEYDGFTDVILAQALGLDAGTHHIKMAIADAGDWSLDSGLFIQGGSVSDKPPSVPEPATMFLLGTGLIGLVGISRKRLNK